MGAETLKVGDQQEVDIDLEDPEVEAAATKIQAGFKGHKARKQLKEQKATTEIEEEGGGEVEVAEVTGTVGEEEEVIDIDLTDPDVEAAATKIQAGFKGHKTRKEMKKDQVKAPESGPEKIDEVEKEEDDLGKGKSEKEETK